MPNLFAALPTAALEAGMALMSRRSNAIADYWRSFAEVRQPTELMAVQLGYISQLIDDYGEALSAGVSQISPATTPEPAPSQAPVHVA